jgi:hypothetical protein
MANNCFYFSKADMEKVHIALNVTFISCSIMMEVVSTLNLFLVVLYLNPINQTIYSWMTKQRAKLVIQGTGNWMNTTSI